jgi:peroxiredoxin
MKDKGETMALLESIEIPLGTRLPTFTLKDCFEKTSHSSDLVGERGLLVFVTCNHCPYAIAVWERVVTLATFAKTLGIHSCAINPNIHPSYPEDSPENMQKEVEKWGIDFPYLVDETQEVAKALKAQCTPDIYLFDKNQTLYYHGRIDDNWQESTKVTKEELKLALIALSESKQAPTMQLPSMGCSIKWKELT